MTPEHREPFEVVARLGGGGFAETFRARVIDDDLRQEYGVDEVAIKVPHDRRAERLLKRELELGAALHLRLKGLRAQNLVRYLGFETFRGQIVMVMEVEEGSLRGRLGPLWRQQALPVEDALRIAEGVLQGLSVIHNEHVVHRDIKPENILLRDRVAKLADFGIGRILESDQMASTQAGTLPYMSPEILGPQGASFTTDIWSCGVTLYEMLTGRLPFGNERMAIRSFIDAICSADPLAPSELREEVPPPLGEIVLRSLAKDPNDRYRSADEMLAALRHFRRGSDEAVERALAEVRELMAAGRGADVEARLRDLSARYPKDPRALQQLGEYLSRCQRHGDAIATFQRALELDPESGLLHWHLALAYQGAGQRPKAAMALERAIALDLDPSLRRHAGLLLKALQGGRG